MKKFNGDIRIENAVWEALTSYRVSGEEMKCLMFVIRKTIGWGKKQDNISLSQFVSKTNMAKSSVCRAINKLKEKNMLLVYKEVNKTHATYEFNRKYKTWKAFTKKSTIYKIVNLRLQNSKFAFTKKRHTIDTTTKDTKQKTKERIDSDESKQSDKDITFSLNNGRPYRISKFLFKLIKERDPKIKEPNWKEWATHIDRLNRIDKRDFTEIKKVIRWCQQDDFWQNNILSTSKLRKQFSQLRLKMLQKPTKQKIGTRYIPKENSRGSESFGKTITELNL